MHELQHASLPCPSLSPRVCSNSYCNTFIILFIQIIHKKQNNFNLTIQYSFEKYSTIAGIQGLGIQWTGKKSYWLEEEDSRAKGSSAIGDGGQAALLTLMSQVLVPCWIQLCLPSWKKMTQWCLGGSSFFHHRWHGSTGLHSERLLQPSHTILHLGPMPQKLTVPPQLKKSPCHFLLHL